MSYLVFDIGGTKTRVATSDDLETFTKNKSFKTPADPKDGIKKIIESVKELCDCEIDGIAGGIRGRLNEDKTAMENDGVLKRWAGFPVVEKLKKAFK